ncbi:MAG: peptide chain release factor 2 [Candidatus Hydrogenedens sp.]|nr:peptide chain release factor 2 [Candidatus Hydrogenedens sp.]
MYELEIQTINNLKQRLTELRSCLNVEGVQERIELLERSMEAPDFWNDPERAQKTLQEIKSLKNAIEEPESLNKELEEAEAFILMAIEEDEGTLSQEVNQLISRLQQEIHQLEIKSLFRDPRDTKPAIVSFHPGAGGTESCDWAQMLYRMIMRYCEEKGLETELVDYQPGEEAGLKSATIRVTGLYAYGLLKSENGVHRLVRISPFDANKRRHTSFTAIEVLSEVDEDIKIEIREEDLKMDTFRSSGAGGQKVNKTSSAVRLTHLPTGFVVSCQVERSQHRNRAMALQMLKAKLYDMEMRKKEMELYAQREGQTEVAWGSQIRSYILQPYQLVKDHRTGAETSNVDRVLDGDLDLFVEAYLKWNLEKKSVGI